METVKIEFLVMGSGMVKLAAAVSYTKSTP